MNVPGPDFGPQNNEASTSTQILCCARYAASYLRRQTEPQDPPRSSKVNTHGYNIHNPNDREVTFQELR